MIYRVVLENNAITLKRYHIFLQAAVILDVTWSHFVTSFRYKMQEKVLVKKGTFSPYFWQPLKIILYKMIVLHNIINIFSKTVLFSYSHGLTLCSERVRYTWSKFTKHLLTTFSVGDIFRQELGIFMILEL